MRKIVCNRDLGFTSTPQEGEAVMRKHGLWGLFEPPQLWADQPPGEAESPGRLPGMW